MARRTVSTYLPFKASLHFRTGVVEMYFDIAPLSLMISQLTMGGCPLAEEGDKTFEALPFVVS